MSTHRYETTLKVRKQWVEMNLTRPNPETGEQEVYDTIGLVAFDADPNEVGPEEIAEMERITQENNRRLQEHNERKYREWYERGVPVDDPGYNEWLKKSYLPE